MIDVGFLASQCATNVAPPVLESLMKVESSFNPYAIGVVGGHLARQPQNKEEAMATALYLERAGWNFSLGLGQVNRYNLDKYGLNYETVFDPCHNARATAGIFNECLQRASVKFSAEQAQQAAFSCYYSGNFWRGFISEGRSQTSYVQRIMAANSGAAIEVIPDGKKRPATQPSRGSKNRPEVSGAKITRSNGNTATNGVTALRGD